MSKASCSLPRRRRPSTHVPTSTQPCSWLSGEPWSPIPVSGCRRHGTNLRERIFPGSSVSRTCRYPRSTDIRTSIGPHSSPSAGQGLVSRAPGARAHGPSPNPAGHATLLARRRGAAAKRCNEQYVRALYTDRHVSQPGSAQTRPDENVRGGRSWLLFVSATTLPVCVRPSIESTLLPESVERRQKIDGSDQVGASRTNACPRKGATPRATPSGGWHFQGNSWRSRQTEENGPNAPHIPIRREAIHFKNAESRSPRSAPRLAPVAAPALVNGGWRW